MVATTLISLPLFSYLWGLDWAYCNVVKLCIYETNYRISFMNTLCKIDDKECLVSHFITHMRRHDFSYGPLIHDIRFE